MSLDVKGYDCVVCHSHFFEDDDVVYCPTCGAPHHRSCYNALGKCGLEELHGTEQQYDAKKAVEQEEKKEPINDDNASECIFCHSKFDNDAKVCPYCGKPRVNVGFMPFDMFGGVDPEQDIGGIKAKEARDLVVVNTHRYMPKFASKKKVSWNWMAFLFPEAWYLSRKMHKLGAVVITLLIVATLLTFPLIQIAKIEMPQEYTRQDFINFVTVYIVNNIKSMPSLLLLSASAIIIAVRFLSGMFGDYWYKKYIIAKVKARSESKLDRNQYNQKFGGVNLLFAAIGLMIATYVPELLGIFLI